MRLRTTLLLIPATCLLFTASMVASACSTPSGGNPTPVESTPPGGVTAQGVTFGGSCHGAIYVVAGIGYAVCEHGKWGYTVDDPAADGYVEVPELPGDAGPDFDAVADIDAEQQGQGGQGGGQGGQQ